MRLYQLQYLICTLHYTVVCTLQATVRKWERGGTDTRTLELYPDVQSIELAEKLFKTSAQ
jgi:hypothetical protein